MEQRLSPAEAADAVEVQPVQVHVHHAGAQEQAQLDEGMVHHMLERAPGRQGTLFSQQRHDREADRDKADLADGGAGKGPLEIHGEERQQGAQQHRNCPQHQQRVAEGTDAGHDVCTQDDHTEYAALGEDAGEQGRGRRRGDRVGLGQPDMQREEAGLGREAEEREPDSSGNRGGRFGSLQRFPETVEGQGADIPVEHEQAHEGGEAADDGDGQVGFRGAHGAGGFLLGHPGVAGEGHDLEEDQRGIQIIRQENAEGGTEGPEIEKPVTVAHPVVMHILRGEDIADEPHKGGHRSVEAAEAVGTQVQAQTAETVDAEADFAGQERETAAQRQRADNRREQIADAVILPAGEPDKRRKHHRTEAEQRQQHVSPSFRK